MDGDGRCGDAGYRDPHKQRVLHAHYRRENGTATVTATATSADGSTQRDTVTITVVTKVENVTIKNGAKIVASTDSTKTGEGLTIYANRSLDSYPSSATLL